MGFASCLEDISDRYWEDWVGGTSAFNAWDVHLGRKPTPPAAQQSPPSDSVTRARRIVRDFWEHYQRPKPDGDATGFWERHRANVAELHSILRPVNGLDENAPGAWDAVSRVEEQLRAFFRRVPVYGPLSPDALERVAKTSREILGRAGVVVKELNEFASQMRLRQGGAPPELEIDEVLQKLREISDRLKSDLAEFGRHKGLVAEVRAWAEAFLAAYGRLAVQARYRPALQHLHRLRLNEPQERLVAHDYQGEYRIQGPAAAGRRSSSSTARCA